MLKLGNRFRISSAGSYFATDEFLEKVYIKMKLARVTQVTIARACMISQSTVSRIFNGKSQPSRATILFLSWRFDVDLYEHIRIVEADWILKDNNNG